MSDNWITGPNVDTSSVTLHDYVTWMDWMQWHPSRPAHYTEPYCYHRAKNACRGDIDFMQVKTLYRGGKPSRHVRGLCYKHAWQLLQDKGVPFVV
jgi:hypothetical protein